MSGSAESNDIGGFAAVAVRRLYRSNVRCLRQDGRWSWRPRDARTPASRATTAVALRLRV